MGPVREKRGRPMNADDEYEGEDEDEGDPEFDVEEQFDEPSFALQLFKAHPYIRLGRKHPGKMHAVRYRSDTEIGEAAACGLKLETCPGDLVTCTPEIEVNCKTCLSALERRSWAHNVIDWRFRWYDGDEPRWTGFVAGEELFSIHRAAWLCLEDSAGDACESLEEGMEACREHLLKRLQASPRRYYGYQF
jgi:hypothetical protein